VAEYHLALEAGPEQSVAATKTYTAQLMAVAMIGTALADSADMLAELKRVPEYVGATLKLSEMVRDWVERYRYISQFVSIGRGYNYCTAFEISLKVKELCYVSGNGYSEADFLHGPIAELHPGFPVMVVAPEGRTLGAMTTFLEKLRERSAEALLISNAEMLFGEARQVMRLPKGVPEWLTPIPAIIPGQMFAMLLAAARGNPLDQPHGLTKVTYTL
jgi:glucosamine--fructose-6-phosphate aminotransferase (isomerizing)